MATGDGNRVWFPEMIETLRSRWNAAMPFPLLIELCKHPRRNVSTQTVQRSNPSPGFPLSRMRENRGFRKSATTQH